MNNIKIDTKEIGRRIRELRLQRGLDQQQLGEVIGVGRSQMSNIERGARRINIAQLKILSSYFNVSFEVLGFENEDTIETLDLLERARILFESNIDIEEKRELAETVYSLYLSAKNK